METQKLLFNASEGKKPLILADTREMNSLVISHLKGLGGSVSEKRLDVGDYVCSSTVACERKTVSDFLASIADQRLFQQLALMSASYDRPVLLIEGNPELMFAQAGLHANAIMGALASIAVDLRIPILWTANSMDSARMLYRIAYREQVAEKKELSIRSAKKPPTLKEQQEFLVSGLPMINSKLSRRLLDHFKSPKELFNATPEELQKVEKIGKWKAKAIWELLNKEYG